MLTDTKSSTTTQNYASNNTVTTNHHYTSTVTRTTKTYLQESKKREILSKITEGIHENGLKLEEELRTRASDEEKLLNAAWAQVKRDGTWVSAKDAILLDVLEDDISNTDGLHRNPVESRLVTFLRKHEKPAGTYYQRKMAKRHRTFYSQHKPKNPESKYERLGFSAPSQLCETDFTSCGGFSQKTQGRKELSGIKECDYEGSSVPKGRGVDVSRTLNFGHGKLPSLTQVNEVERLGSKASDFNASITLAEDKEQSLNKIPVGEIDQSQNHNEITFRDKLKKEEEAKRMLISHTSLDDKLEETEKNKLKKTQTIEEIYENGKVVKMIETTEEEYQGTHPEFEKIKAEVSRSLMDLSKVRSEDPKKKLPSRDSIHVEKHFGPNQTMTNSADLKHYKSVSVNVYKSSKAEPPISTEKVEGNSMRDDLEIHTEHRASFKLETPNLAGNEDDEESSHQSVNNIFNGINNSDKEYDGEVAKTMDQYQLSHQRKVQKLDIAPKSICKEVEERDQSDHTFGAGENSQMMHEMVFERNKGIPAMTGKYFSNKSTQGQTTIYGDHREETREVGKPTPYPSNSEGNLINPHQGEMNIRDGNNLTPYTSNAEEKYKLFDATQYSPSKVSEINSQNPYSSKPLYQFETTQVVKEIRKGTQLEEKTSTPFSTNTTENPGFNFMRNERVDYENGVSEALDFKSIHSPKKTHQESSNETQPIEAQDHHQNEVGVDTIQPIEVESHPVKSNIMINKEFTSCNKFSENVRNSKELELQNEPTHGTEPYKLIHHDSSQQNQSLKATTFTTTSGSQIHQKEKNSQEKEEETEMQDVEENQAEEANRTSTKDELSVKDESERNSPTYPPQEQEVDKFGIAGNLDFNNLKTEIQSHLLSGDKGKQESEETSEAYSGEEEFLKDRESGTLPSGSNIGQTGLKSEEPKNSQQPNLKSSLVSNTSQNSNNSKYQSHQTQNDKKMSLSECEKIAHLINNPNTTSETKRYILAQEYGQLTQECFSKYPDLNSQLHENEKESVSDMNTMQHMFASNRQVCGVKKQLFVPKNSEEYQSLNQRITAKENIERRRHTQNLGNISNNPNTFTYYHAEIKKQSNKDFLGGEEKSGVGFFENIPSNGKLGLEKRQFGGNMFNPELSGTKSERALDLKNAFNEEHGESSGRMYERRVTTTGNFFGEGEPMGGEDDEENGGNVTDRVKSDMTRELIFE